MYKLYKLSPEFKSQYDFSISNYVVTSDVGFFYIRTYDSVDLAEAIRSTQTQTYTAYKRDSETAIPPMCELLLEFDIDTHPELFI